MQVVQQCPFRQNLRCPLLVSQHSHSTVGSDVNKDGEEEVLAGSINQITPVSTNKYVW